MVFRTQCLGTAKVSSPRGGASRGPQGSQLISLNADGSNVLRASELRDSRRTSQIQAGGCFRRQITPVANRDRLPDISELSTADNTPTDHKPEVVQLRAVDLVRRQRTVQRFSGSLLEANSVQVDGNEFLDTIPARSAMSDGAGYRDVYSRMMAEARVYRLVEEAGEKETEYDSVLELKDAKRVRAGNCGIMKFAKMIGLGQLSRQDSRGYWHAKARLARHDVLSFLRELSRVAYFNMTEHQRRTVAISLEQNKNMFDKDTVPDVLTTIKILKGKYKMEAQFKLFPSWNSVDAFLSATAKPTIEIHHKIDIPSVMQHIGTHLPKYNAWSKIIVFVGGYALMTTFGQRVAYFMMFLVSLDLPEYVLTCLHPPTQVRQRGVGDDDTAFEAQMAAPVSEISDELAEAAMGHLDANRESLVASLCHVVSSVFSKETSRDMWETAIRAKRIQSIAQVCNNTGSMITFFSKVFMWVHEYVEAWSYDMDLQSYKLFKISPELPKFVSAVAHLYDNGGAERALKDQAVAAKVRELYVQGVRYWDYLTTCRAPPSQTLAMSRAWDLLLRMHEAARIFYAAQELRPEPFCVWLRGEPGVGKSRLLDHLGPVLCHAINVKPTSYVRNIHAHHWDGYAEQSVVIFDDFFQSTDAKLRAVESVEFIRAKNNKAWVLHVAELERKGVTLYTSPILLVTSNVDIYEDTPSISNYKALQRRRDVLVEVRVIPEFANEGGGPNIDLIKEVFDKEYTTDIFKFTVYKPLHPDQVASDKINDNDEVMELKDLTYDQFTDYIRRKVRIHHARVNVHEREEGVVTFDPALDVPQHIGEDIEVSTESDFSEDDYDIEDSLIISWLEQRGFSPTPETVNMLRTARDCGLVRLDKGITLSERAFAQWKRFKSNFARITGVACQKISANPTKASMVPIIAGALLAVSGALAGYAMLRRSHQHHGEAFASGDARTRYVKKSYVIQKHNVLQPDVAQGTVDPRALVLVKERFASMVCLVTLVKENGHKVSTQGLLLGGKLIVTPYHLFASTPRVSLIEVITVSGMYSADPREVAICENWKDYDMTILIMPNAFPSFPKQFQHFVNEADITSLHLSKVCILTAQCEGERVLPVMQFVSNVLRRGEHRYVSKGDEVLEIRIVSSLHYDAQTEAGDCGAPLIWFHPGVSRKILGFHVAGGAGVGASNILTMELMMDVFKKLHTTTLSMPTTTDGPPTLQDGLANIGQMAYLGLVPSDKQFRQPSKSEIVPSCIHGGFPVISQPAILRITDGVSPLEKGVRKAFCPVARIPKEDLEIVMQQVLMHYLNAEQPMGHRVLTLQEGLNGVRGCQWIRPLNMKTSPGYPYILDKGRKPGKHSYVSFEDGEWHASPQFEDAIRQRIQLASGGEIPETVFVDVLKDERRELEKIADKKTRVFNTCPMDLSVAIRMYFGTFAAMIMHNHVTHETAVGLNYHSSEWEMLYRRLKENGSNWIAGDYSNYDKTFPRQLMLSVAFIANEFYNDENGQIRITLMETLASRIHLANRVLYFSPHGNPSGNPLTSIINSLGNMMLMRLAWLHLSRTYNPKVELDFSKFVQLSVYGDDNVATVPNTVTWYNMVNIANTMAMWGVTYTPPKVGNVSMCEFLPEAEVSYLKRYFRKEGGIVFAPLPEERIKDTCNWIRECADHKEATRLNVFMAQLEMFHWGPRKFETFARDAYRLLGKAGIEPLYVSYSHFHTRYLSGSLKELSEFVHPVDPLSTAPECEEALDGSGRCFESQPGSEHINKLVAIQMEAQAKNSAATKQATPKTKTQSIVPRTSSSNNKVVASNPVVLQVTQSNAQQLPSGSENISHRYKDSDLLVRLDGTAKIFAVRLQPGRTGVAKLDQLAQNYSWYRFDAAPVLKYRPLTDITSNGIWFYRVVHDATYAKLADPNMWDVNSRAFTAQKSSLPFSITVPTENMRTKKGSPLTSTTCSYILLVHVGQVVDYGEFHLSYDVTLGGVSGGMIQPTTYEVKDGQFLDPLTGKPLEGIPVVGSHTAYTFNPPIEAPAAQQLCDAMGATPTLAVRPENYPVAVRAPTYGQISTIAVAHTGDAKPSVAQKVLEFGKNAADVIEAGDTAVRGVKRLVRYVRPILKLLGKSRDGVDTRDGPPSGGVDKDYEGFVTVEDGHAAHLRWVNSPSMPVLILEESGGDSKTRLAVLPFITSILGGVAVDLTLSAIQAIVNKASKQKHVVHKGMDALTSVQITQTPPTDTNPSPENPEENPLPDLPDFGDDPLAPGAAVDWKTTVRFFSGFVSDDNGRPIVKWLGGTDKDASIHISPPTPVNYYKVRKPWDQEDKRLLACYVEVDPALKGHYILMQAVNWGDDACCSWWKEAKGATYIGTVARFAGLTESRSVIRIDDVLAFNDNEVTLTVGQSKHSALSDGMRSSVFNVMLGAVADYEIAVNFLECWVDDPLRNIWHDKSDTGTSSYSTAKDFSSSRQVRSDMSGLVPFAPGFEENYAAYMSAGGSAASTRAKLPITLNAGPFYVNILARVDNANGWYQHVPYFIHTQTSLSSRWSAEMLLGCNGSDAEYVAPTSTETGRVPIVSIRPPSNLVDSATELAIEVRGFANESCVDGARPADGLDHNGVVGPIDISRYHWTNKSEISFHVPCSTKRPADAVKSDNKDYYCLISLTAYVLKDSSATCKWANLFSETTSGGLSYKRRMFGLKPQAGQRSWTWDGTAWPSSGYHSWSYSSAPIGSSCPLYQPSGVGRSREGALLLHDYEVLRAEVSALRNHLMDLKRAYGDDDEETTATAGDTAPPSLGPTEELA